MPKAVWALLALVIINLPQGLDSWSNLIAKMEALRVGGLVGMPPMPEVSISLSWLATPLGYMIFGLIVGWDTSAGQKARRFIDRWASPILRRSMLSPPNRSIPALRFTEEDGGIFPMGQWMTVFSTVRLNMNIENEQSATWLLDARIAWECRDWLRGTKLLLRHSWHEAVIDGEVSEAHDPLIITPSQPRDILLRFNADRARDIFEHVPHRSRLILELELQGVEPIRQPLWNVRLKDWDHPAECAWIGDPIQATAPLLLVVPPLPSPEPQAPLDHVRYETFNRADGPAMSLTLTTWSASQEKLDSLMSVVCHVQPPTSSPLQYVTDQRHWVRSGDQGSASPLGGNDGPWVRISALYPINYPEAPLPMAMGEYRVTWYAAFARGALSRVGETTFVVDEGFPVRLTGSPNLDTADSPTGPMP